MVLYSVRMRASASDGSHISGAEGIFEESGVDRAIRRFYKRAEGHPRGKPARVVLTVEKLREKPASIKALDVRTLICDSPREARPMVLRLLLMLGISEAAVKAAFDVLTGGDTMRGAALVDALEGKRLEPDSGRGVRASLMGFDARALRLLSGRLSRKGINTQTVKEALLLASKVAACPGIVAELCASDDPDYTTGYLASPELGYLRIPNIKSAGSRHGGRVFFVSPGAEVGRIVDHLEQAPVLLSEPPGVSGNISIDDVSLP